MPLMSRRMTLGRLPRPQARVLTATWYETSFQERVMGTRMEFPLFILSSDAPTAPYVNIDMMKVYCVRRLCGTDDRLPLFGLVDLPAIFFSPFILFRLISEVCITSLQVFGVDENDDCETIFQRRYKGGWFILANSLSREISILQRPKGPTNTK